MGRWLVGQLGDGRWKTWLLFGAGLANSLAATNNAFWTRHVGANTTQAITFTTLLSVITRAALGHQYHIPSSGR